VSPMANNPRSIRAAGALSIALGVTCIFVAVRFRALSSSPAYLIVVCASASLSAALGLGWIVLTAGLWAIRKAAIDRGLLPGARVAPPAAPPRFPPSRPRPGSAGVVAPPPAAASDRPRCVECGAAHFDLFRCDTHGGGVRCSGCTINHVSEVPAGVRCLVSFFRAAAVAPPPAADGGA
jgi:hypothetical protein